MADADFLGGMLGGGMPPELATEAGQIRRRRLLLDAMTARGLAQPEGKMVSGHYISPGIGALINPIAAAYSSNVMNDRLDQQQTELGQKYNVGMADAVKRYSDARLGTPAQPAQGEQILQPNTPHDDEGNVNPTIEQPAQAAVPAQPQTPQNRLMANIQAMTSGYGPLHEMAKADLAVMAKQHGLEPQDILKLSDFAPADRVKVAMQVANGVPFQAAIAGLNAKPNIVAHEGQFADTSSGRVVPLTGATLGDKTVPENWQKDLPPGAIPTGPGTYRLKDPNSGSMDRYGMEYVNGALKQTKMLDQAPKVTVGGATIHNKMDLAANDKGLGAATKIWEKSAEQATTARQSKGMITQLRENNAATPEGQTAEAQVWTRKLASSMGLTVDQSKNINSQVFENTLYQKLSSYLTGTSGARISDTDAKVIRASLPQISYSRAAREQILTIMDKYANQQIGNHDSLTRQLSHEYPDVPVFRINLAPDIRQETVPAYPSPAAYGGTPRSK